MDHSAMALEMRAPVLLLDWLYTTTGLLDDLILDRESPRELCGQG